MEAGSSRRQLAQLQVLEEVFNQIKETNNTVSSVSHIPPLLGPMPDSVGPAGFCRRVVLRLVR